MACRQYSQLTMGVRTLAQHVMLAFVVGLGIIFSNVLKEPNPPWGWIGLCTGVVLMVFACVLWILNFHHSMAFRAIREVLVDLEKGFLGDVKKGPWGAHAEERNMTKIWRFNASTLAWHAPFTAMIVIGFVTTLVSLWTFGFWWAAGGFIVSIIVFAAIVVDIFWWIDRTKRNASAGKTL